MTALLFRVKLSIINPFVTRDTDLKLLLFSCFWLVNGGSNYI